MAYYQNLPSSFPLNQRLPLWISIQTTARELEDEMLPLPRVNIYLIDISCFIFEADQRDIDLVHCLLVVDEKLLRVFLKKYPHWVNANGNQYPPKIHLKAAVDIVVDPYPDAKLFFPQPTFFWDMKIKLISSEIFDDEHHNLIPGRFLWDTLEDFSIFSNFFPYMPKRQLGGRLFMEKLRKENPAYLLVFAIARFKKYGYETLMEEDIDFIPYVTPPQIH